MINITLFERILYLLGVCTNRLRVIQADAMDQNDMITYWAADFILRDMEDYENRLAQEILNARKEEAGNGV